MKKVLLFLLSVCMIFSSLVFCLSAEEELEAYDGMLCVKGELVLWTTVYVAPVICEDGESVDFFGISVTEIDALFTIENGGLEQWEELSDNRFPYCIKVAPDVDIYEAKAALLENENIIEVGFNPVAYPDDDETETPVSKTVEFTESIFESTGCKEEVMSDFGLETSLYGKEATPVIIDSRDMIETLSECYHESEKTEFDDYFAKYDEAFFEDNALIAVLALSPDYGYTYEILSLEYAEDGETLVFGFRCIGLPYDWPTEVMDNLVMAEVKKEDIADCTSVTTEHTQFYAALGDVNLDGTVDSLDYLMAKRAAFGTFELSKAQFVCADVYPYRSSAIDSADYLLIKRIAFGTYTVG
ncbi:MAG: dockerin type I repeat-containing protein [Clostridia bacterium]|nr:dockerin type I repeat-containing protein [Clostridia bacterium]